MDYVRGVGCFLSNLIHTEVIMQKLLDKFDLSIIKAEKAFTLIVWNS